MKSIIITSFLILTLILIFPEVNAQSESLKEAEQKMVEVTIDSEGNVSVVHQIKNSDEPRIVNFVDGTVSNLVLIDRFGSEEQVEVFEGMNSIPITANQGEFFVEYDLDDVLVLKDGYWTWDFVYLESTTFILPQKSDLIFVNENPVLLGERKGIMCHGCQMKLQYSFTESKIIENVKWEEKDFDVEIRTLAELNDFTFKQSEKSITLDVNDADRFVTIIIPLELLWEPYTVFIDDEKIRVHKFLSNGTHVGLGFKSGESGEIFIVGTTVVPEFPIFAPLAVGLMAILVMPFLRKFNLR